MLICKNCFTENPDGTHKCKSCQMEGNFVYKKSEGEARVSLVIEDLSIVCHNCGSDTPGMGSKCAHCHFPIEASVRKKQQELAELQKVRNLKTG